MDAINDQIDSYVIGGKYGFEFIPMEGIAQSLGVSAVGLRFMFGILVGYPFSFIYLLFPNSSYNRKHLYFTVTGITITYFCFGADCIYNLFSIFLSYVSFSVLGPSMKNVLFNFIFHTAYLFFGYVVNATDSYDVKWTTPQCILCLRLIGLAWDVYDGHQPEESLSPEQKYYRITKTPSFMELFGFSYCFCGCLSGPQFSFQRYLRFTTNTLVDKDVQDKQNGRFVASFKRFMSAVIVLTFFTMFDSKYKSDMLLTSEVLAKPFFEKVLLMGIIYYVQFAKYVFVWWFAESVSMLIGLSYDGKDEDGKPKWEGLNNFKFRKFFFGAFFQDIIESFNIQTNRWSGRYVFKRLRFLGNRTASHVLTLIYLSVWHGFYIGYLVMFVLEFVTMIVEKEVRITFYKVTNIGFDELPLSKRIPLQVFGALFKFLACGFYVQSFMLLRWRRFSIVYKSVYWWPVVVFVGWFVIGKPLLTMIARSNKKRSDTTGDSKKTD